MIPYLNIFPLHEYESSSKKIALYALVYFQKASGNKKGQSDIYDKSRRNLKNATFKTVDSDW